MTLGTDQTRLTQIPFNAAPGEPAGYCRFWDGAAFTDCDAAMLKLDGSYFGLWADASDILYVGCASPFAFVGFRAQTPGDYGTFTFEYWDGAAWSTLTALHNSTAGFSKDGYLAWVMPGDWDLKTVDGVSAYWIRASVDAVTTQAYAYNLLRSVTLNAPLHVLPTRNAPLLGRDINGLTFRRDTPRRGPDRLTIEVTQIAAVWGRWHVLWDWWHYGTRVYIESGAKSVPISAPMTTDAYAHAYKGRIVALPPGVSTPDAMQIPPYSQIEIEVDEVETLTGRLGVTV